MLKKLNDLGFVTKIIIAIILGIILGQLDMLPEWFLRIFVTISSLLSSFLNFIVPVMIVAFVVSGITNIKGGAGKTLGLTVVLSYTSYVFVGLTAYFIGYNLYPKFIQVGGSLSLSEGFSLEPLIDFPIDPFFTVTGALVFGFMAGLSLNALNNQGKGQTLTKVFDDLSSVISLVLEKLFIPLVPFLVLGNFVNLSYSGQFVTVIKTFGLVFLVFIFEHWLCLLLYLTVGSLYAGRSPKETIKNTLEPYMYAFGTQSSAMSIPVSIKTAVKNGNDENLSSAILPLTASMHVVGSMITVINLSLASLILYGMDYSPATFIPMIFIIALALIATPGVPGGAAMAVVPYMEIVGIMADGPIASLIITLYLAQDSFGTSTNVASDQGLIAVIDKVYKDKIKKDQ